MISRRGSMPLVTAAIHNGHTIRAELLPYLKLSEHERLREEDPFTEKWAQISENRVLNTTSRFETDVNRPRDKAVYLRPEQAWGMEVWSEPLPEGLVEKSLQVYDEFYTRAGRYFDDLFLQYKNLIVYDLHSFNHRRAGFDQYADPETHPELNIGTKNLDRERWSGVIGAFLESARAYNFEGRKLDIRENVKFQGGYFGEWLYRRYGEQICVLSIEVKKFFMDEWTGEIYEREVRHLRELLIGTVRPVLRQLDLTPVL